MTEKIKDLLENNFLNISKEYVTLVADVLADFYIYQYHFYRKSSRFDEIFLVLEQIISEEWYVYAPTIKKIKIRL